MKFKDLPEGYYFILDINKSVYVKLLENHEEQESFVLEREAIKVVHDGRTYRKYGRVIDDLEAEFKTYEDIKKERKSRGASLGHLKRRIALNEPLTGEVLKSVLRIVGVGDEGAISKDPFYMGIADKLRAGQPLTDYELHMMIDVRLVHERF